MQSIAVVRGLVSSPGAEKRILWRFFDGGDAVDTSYISAVLR
jgi:hypothetical protein